MIQVCAGQIWEDMDSRTATTTIKVIRVHGCYVICERGERMVKIRLDRMKPGSRGYRLVKDTVDVEEAGYGA